MSSESLKVLEKLLDYSALRQKVINKNIANVTTVNYQREEIKFNEVLSGEISKNMKTTDLRHFPNQSGEIKSNDYEVVKDKSGEKVSGFNNVDINQEMSDLAENSLMFRFGSKKLAGYFQTLQNVIKGGGGI